MNTKSISQISLSMFLNLSLVTACQSVKKEEPSAATTAPMSTSSSAAASTAEKNDKPDPFGTKSPVVGNWRWQGHQQINGKYPIAKEYSFTLSRLEKVVTVFADNQMKKPILVYRAEGPYKIESDNQEAGKKIFVVSHKVSQQYLIPIGHDLKSKDFKLPADCLIGQRKTERNITKLNCDPLPNPEKCSDDYEIFDFSGNGGVTVRGPAGIQRSCDLEQAKTVSAIPVRKLI